MESKEIPLSPAEILKKLDNDIRIRNTKLKWKLVQECNLSSGAEIESTLDSNHKISILTIIEKGVTTKFHLIDEKVDLSATEQWSLSDDENAVQFIVEQMHKNHIVAATSLFGNI